MTDFKAKVRDSQSPNILSFRVLRLLVPQQGSALDLLGGLQRSEDPLLISSCLRHEKRPFTHKNGGMTKCLEKPLGVLLSILRNFQNSFVREHLGTAGSAFCGVYGSLYDATWLTGKLLFLGNFLKRVKYFLGNYFSLFVQSLLYFRRRFDRVFCEIIGNDPWEEKVTKNFWQENTCHGEISYL